MGYVNIMYNVVSKGGIESVSAGVPGLVDEAGCRWGVIVHEV